MIKDSGKLHSLDVEKMALSGLLKFPQVISDLPAHITEKDFSSRAHQIIFAVIKNTIEENKPLEPVLIGERIKHMGIALDDGFDMIDYLSSFALIAINENSVVPYFQVLKKYSIARELDGTANTIKKEIVKNIDSDALSIISKCDEIYNSKINLLDSDEREVISVFDDMENLILGRAEKPSEDIGLLSPFKLYNDYCGGFRDGNVYMWASRAGQGKSSMLTHLGMNLAMSKEKCAILYLDTEMFSEDISLRMAASLSNVNFWWIDSGNFIKNPEMYEKIKKALEIIKKDNYIFHHKYVASLDINQIVSLIKRWSAKVGRDRKKVIIYDYLKLCGGEQLSQSFKEYQAIGEKMQRLKDVAMEIKAPLLSAVQINRTGSEDNEGGTNDTESVISQSDRILWLASFLSIFRRKTLREIERDGPMFGTHLMRILKTRFQGKLSMGHSDFVKIENPGKKPSYVSNYLNYNVENFSIEERGDLREMIKRQIFKQNENEEIEKDFYENEPKKIILEKVN